MSCTCLCSSGGRLMRFMSPSTRIIGSTPADRCRSEAPCFTLKVSSCAISTVRLPKIRRPALSPKPARHDRDLSLQAQAESAIPSIGMNELIDRWTRVRERIAAACARAGRPLDAVRLVAVSKTFPAERIAALATAGQDDFGENYLQEALTKLGPAETLAGRALRWHFIGPI